VDLATVFTNGQKVRVLVIEPRQGKVRLRLEGATPRTDERPERSGGEAAGARPASGAPATPGAPEGTGEGAPRRSPERGRPERGRGREAGRSGFGGEGRAPEGRRAKRSRDEGARFGRDRDSRDFDESGERGGDARRPRESKVIVVSTRPASEELTPMALALRKAMEKANEKKKPDA